MSQLPFTSPTFELDAFNCPNCHAYAAHHWSILRYVRGNTLATAADWNTARCSRCKQFSMWYKEDMVFPDLSIAPPPNTDLPEEIRNDYIEASGIISRSPRGAAALLRLCIQKLCKHLGEKGKNINDDVAELVKKGLSAKIQKGLDIVRVIGNEAVHPGTIDIRDNPEIAVKLCSLINIIADAMITQPKMIDDLYGSLPENKVKEIERRDGS